MHAACSREGRHTWRPDCLLFLLLPDNQHMHTKRGTYTSPRMRVQRVLTPAKESAEKGMFLGGESRRRRGRAEAGRQQTGWPAAQTITKMGSEIFKDAVAAPSAELWPGCICLPRQSTARLVPWGTMAIRERLRVQPWARTGSWGRKPAAGSDRNALERATLGW